MRRLRCEWGVREGKELRWCCAFCWGWRRCCSCEKRGLRRDLESRVYVVNLGTTTELRRKLLKVRDPDRIPPLFTLNRSPLGEQRYALLGCRSGAKDAFSLLSLYRVLCSRAMSSDSSELLHSFQTSQIHAGHRPDPTTNAIAVPIYATTAFTFNDAQHDDDIGAHKVNAYPYSRTRTPLRSCVRGGMTQLEGGHASVATATGQAPTLLAILALAKAGDNFVTSTKVRSRSCGELEAAADPRALPALRRDL